MKYLLLLSTYNNEKNFLEKYEDIIDSELDLDILVVDRGSGDRTKHFLRNNNVPRLEMAVHNPYYSAVSLGLQYAYENNYDGVVEFDINGSFKIEDIPYLVATYEKSKVDFVLGSRYLDTTKKTHKRNKLLRLISRIWLNKKITDPATRFKLFGKNAIAFYGKQSKISVPQPDSIVNLIKINYTFKEVYIETNDDIKKQPHNRYWRSLWDNVIWTMIIIFVSPYRKAGKK